jgi:hypothetical protein
MFKAKNKASTSKKKETNDYMVMVRFDEATKRIIEFKKRKTGIPGSIIVRSIVMKNIESWEPG